MLLNWNEILLLTLHKNWLLWWFIIKSQYHTNTVSLIDITIPNQFVFYFRNHFWLLFVKKLLEPKDLPKINRPIYNNYWEIELGNTISKKTQNIGVALFTQIWSCECYIKCFKIFDRTQTNLEAFYIALIRPDLNEQCNSNVSTLFRNGITQFNFSIIILNWSVFCFLSSFMIDFC